MKTRARASSDRQKVDLSTSPGLLRQSPVKLVGGGGILRPIIQTKTIRRSPNRPEDNSPVRRQKNISRNQDERMTFITKALDGYSDDLEKLFSVSTWKTLIRNAKKGAQDERRFKIDGNLTRFAKIIIEQITSTEYSQKVGQVLSAPTTRRGRVSPSSGERATKFMMLAADFDQKQEDLVWRKAIGEDIEEQDSENNSAIGNNHGGEDHNMVEDRCVMLELEVEGEKENASYSERQTRNSTKAQQAPLRVKSSQTLGNCRTAGWQYAKNEPPPSVNYLATISIPKDNFECKSTETSGTNGFEYYPAVGSSSSTSTVEIERDFDDLPDLEPPDTGRDKENLPKSEQEILRDYPRPQSGPELNFRMFEEIEEALSRPKKDKIVTAFGLTLMQEQLAVYNKSEWLEDANIDFYLEMIKYRNNREDSSYPSVYIFQSYFYKLLDKRGYESVQGATGKDNIFQYDLLLIPIHSDHHWVLVVVDFNKKTMKCYDSMDHDNEKHLRIIAAYLKREYKELTNKLARMTHNQREVRNSSTVLNSNFFNEEDDSWDNYLGVGWAVHNLGAEDIPQQKNGRDCGVFCLQFAEYLSRRQTFDFEQKHTAYFRKRMLFETLQKTLLIS